MDCLVTKLKGTVNDSSLKALGELTLKYKGSGKHDFQCLATKDIRYVIKSGNAVFLDSDLSSEIGKDITVSNNSWRSLRINDENEVVVGIMDKYSLTALEMKDNVSDYDLSELIYIKGLTRLNIVSPSVTGDVSILRNTNLQEFRISNNKSISGNLSDFPNSITGFYINGQSLIEGNLGDIPTIMPNLKSITITNQTAGNMQKGNFSAFVNMQALNEINIYASGLTYDWSSSTLRNNSYPRIVVATKNYPVAFTSPTDADNFIINMSTCSNEGISNNRVISITERTAASNSAIKTLISDGWKVYVNSVEQTGSESFG